MLTEDFDTEAYAFQIRQLAAQYQSGANLSQIKRLVDLEIISMETNLKYHYQSRFHLNMWSSLFQNLNAYVTKHSDPKWLTVIVYARRQVSRKKGAAKTRIKQTGAPS